MSEWRDPAGGDDAFAQYVARRISGIPGVLAVTLGGSRADGTHRPDSDWDFSLYYRGTFEPGDLRTLGWPGEIFPCWSTRPASGMPTWPWPGYPQILRYSP